MLRLLLLLLLQLLQHPGFTQNTENNSVLASEPSKRLATAIAHYQTLTDSQTEWSLLPDSVVVAPAQRAAFIPALQQKLLLLNDLPVKDSANATTYTSRLVTAVKRFQKRHGLVADGVLGPKTIAALNVAPALRLRQLQLNLERWDTLFTYLPSTGYVLISIPDYTLRVIDTGQVKLVMKVIVGKPAFQTYIHRSQLNMLVFNPKWHIPTSIAVNEILPIIKRNPAYLAKKRMQVEYKTKSGKYERINPWRVNWKEINSKNFDFRIIQMPSAQNELGQVKFLFPNHVAQYLHDTPKKEFFKQDYRALSHGCIRLEKPQELADYLLTKSAGYSPEKIKKLRSVYKPDHYILLKQPTPLFIVYLTAWVDEQMQVQFRDDIYKYDLGPKLVTE